jgi:hypothetical protein
LPCVALGISQQLIKPDLLSCYPQFNTPFIRQNCHILWSLTTNTLHNTSPCLLQVQPVSALLCRVQILARVQEGFLECIQDTADSIVTYNNRESESLHYDLLSRSTLLNLSC